MKTKAFIVLVFLLQISISHAFENFEQAFYQMQHRYSLGHYKRTIAIAPTALALSKNTKQIFQVLYYKALALNALQDFWLSAQVFEKAAKTKNISQRQKLLARYGQVRSQYAGQHFLSALGNAEKYSDFTDKPSVLQLNILLIAIESARQLNQNNKALSLAQKMKKNTNPNSAWYYRGMIMEIQILCSLKNYQKAKQAMNKVDITKLPSPMRSEFFALAGFCYEKNKQLKAAGKLYSFAYEKDSSYYSGLAALRHANLLSRKGENLDEITEKYAKVLESPRAHPRHKSQAIYKIAQIVYKQQKKPETALRYLARIKDVKNPSVYWQAKIYNLHGNILYKKGETREAKKYYQACLKLSKPLSASKLNASEIMAQMEEKVVLPEKQ